MATCREFSSDLATLSEFKAHFLNVETNTHPNSAVFPWLYHSVRRSKEASVKALHSTLAHFVEKRRQATVPNSDAIDILLAQNASTPDIVLLSLGSIFAGFLIFIFIHPEWKTAILAELKPLVSQYGNAADPVHRQPAMIPSSVWDSSMPTIDLVMRETIRLVINHTALRRNVGESFDMPGGVGEIKRGSFLAYSLADAHLDPGVYSRPHLFDPERFRPDREEDPSAFLGFGAGRHRCLASKLARLEIKSIVALFLMTYDYEVVDANGNFLQTIPAPDYNDVQLARPKDMECFLRFKRMENHN
ncbi:cytochrome P450 [Dendrothele bispora CBS 962.96]|uniref:Cytochrome P450 n=1 Tax=Dendrothele bispora (strain CBS 962.96) TaxID=1314807 RepID=A0A4S8L647_DENBC|nr:cytochrome P450 [Dendrothele bispora CBS 962.96]